MDVRLVTSDGVEQRPLEELATLLTREDGVVWVDIPDCDEPAVRVLSEVFGFHPMAVQDCVERNRVPKVHAYADHVFVVLHAPERGQRGHVHYIELDQFAGRNYLVTVHGPLNPAVDPVVALRETGAVLQRIEAGRLRPATPFELSYAIVSALARRQEDYVETATTDVWRLEQQVTGGHIEDPEEFLNQLFRARHGLLAVRTMGALSGAIYGRMTTLARISPDGQRLEREDLATHPGQLYPERRDQEDLRLGGDRLRPHACRDRVRDELRPHAGVALDRRLPVRIDSHGARFRRALSGI